MTFSTLMPLDTTTTGSTWFSGMIIDYGNRVMNDMTVQVPSLVL